VVTSPNPPHSSEVFLHELAIDMPDDILHASPPAPPMPAPPLFHHSSPASSNKLRLSTDGEVDVDAAILHSSSSSGNSTSLLPLPPPLALTFHFAILVKVPRLPAADDSNSTAPVVTFDPMVLQGLEDLAKRLALAGFLVRLESRPAYKKHAPHVKLVFLLHAPDAILSDMQAKMEVERWVAGGRNGEHFLAPQQHGKLTSADRIVLVDRLLHAPRRHGGLGLLELQSSCPFKAFPLHDDQFNREYLTHWFLQWRAYFRNNTDSVEKIRLHFGEKAALYFAYMDFYTKWLLPLALWGLFIYFLSAFSSTLYFRMSAITGLAVSTLWATLFLICWKRRRSELRLKWGVGAQEHVHVTNPHFQPPPPTASLNGVKWSRRLKYIVGYLVLVVFLVGETVITIGFVDLYFFLKAGCGGNCSTGGLENWVLVLCQGILLGLVVDIIQYQIFRVIAVSLTQWENHPTEKRYESSRALKVFLWDFFGIYSWFWMCAFVYVPYGSQFSSLLNEYNLLPWTSSYEPGLLELQSMFVTPLVATQGLKIVFEKIIPYFLLQAAKKASDAKGMYDVYHSTLAENFDRDGKTASVAATASPPSPPTGATLPPLLRAKSSTRIISDMLTSLPKLSRKLTTSSTKSPTNQQAQGPSSQQPHTPAKLVKQQTRSSRRRSSNFGGSSMAFQQQRQWFLDRVLDQAHQDKENEGKGPAKSTTGTPVTVASFNAWKAAFDLEMATKTGVKIAVGAEKRLTGTLCSFHATRLLQHVLCDDVCTYLGRQLWTTGAAKEATDADDSEIQSLDGSVFVGDDNDDDDDDDETIVHIDPLDACVHDILDEAATSPPNPPHPSEVMLHELAIDMPDDILHASLPAPPMPAPPLFHQSSSASSNKLRLSTDGEVDVDAAILHSSSISSTSLLPLPPPLALTFHFAILVKVPRLPAADDGNSIAPVVTFDPMVLQGLEDLAKRLALAGFLVRLESRPAYKKHAPHLKLVFLLHAPDAILSDMQAKMEVERWVAGGRNGEHFLAPQQHGKLTSADRIVLVDRLLHAPRRHGGLGLLELQSSCPFKAFPLHDDRFNREYLTHWFLQWRAYFRNNTDSVEKIRVHFGEKAALYFAYMDFYTKWLLPLALWGLFIYFLSAFSPTLYFRMSAITGLAVSTLWATLFLICWKRRRSELRLKWGVGAQEHAHVINPHFQPPPPTASLNGVKWSRRLKYIVGYLVLVVFLVGETVITIGFVDLYFFLKAGCGGNCSTGGLENWVLVLCQGILLGLVVDIIQYQIFRVIAVSLTQWENHPTEKRYESSRALKVFLWDFFGIYSWFWMCAFVYVPYGSQFSSLLNEYNLLPWTSSYEPGLLELQSMFVTPLVATQGLKIVFEKIIPYFLLQAAKKASDAKGMYDV
ncbi:hypothetical protein DYB26_009902, partial [Aphanomyces astaci]